MTEEPDTSLKPIEPRRTGTRWLRWVAIGVLAYIVLVFAVLIALAPFLPKTALGWGILLLLGPPLYLAGSWLGEKFSEPWGESTPLRKTAKALGLIVAAIVFMIVGAFFTGMGR